MTGVNQLSHLGTNIGAPERGDHLGNILDVCVIDDHALLAESVVMALRSADIAAYSLAFDTPKLSEVIIARDPSLVLLDLFLGSESVPSLDTLVALKKAGLQVLIVTATFDRLLHARCLELGAIGIVVKSEPIDALIQAVEHGLRNETVMSKSKSSALLAELVTSRQRSTERSLFDSLTGREREVLFGLTNGHPAGWIARQHGTSLVTVRTHVRSILHKLGVHSQLEAVSMAARMRWFE